MTTSHPLSTSVHPNLRRLAACLTNQTNLTTIQAAALVKISRGFDRPGALGFATFVLPLILDGIFHGKFPKLFAPNTIAMLQRDGLSFTDVQRRKRLDRAVQLMVVGSVLTGMGAAVKVSSASTLPNSNQQPPLPSLATERPYPTSPPHRLTILTHPIYTLRQRRRGEDGADVRLAGGAAAGRRHASRLCQNEKGGHRRGGHTGSRGGREVRPFAERHGAGGCAGTRWR